MTQQLERPRLARLRFSVSSLTSVALTTGGLLLLATSASAGAHVHGSICQVANVPDAARLKDLHASLGGVFNVGTSAINVTCPSPIDHNVGGSLQWSTMVNDNSTTAAVECFGGALDIAGTLLGSTPVVSSGAAPINKRQLLYSFTVADGSADYSYASSCFLPAVTANGTAGIHTLRVF